MAQKVGAKEIVVSTMDMAFSFLFFFQMHAVCGSRYCIRILESCPKLGIILIRARYCSLVQIFMTESDIKETRLTFVTLDHIFPQIHFILFYFIFFTQFQRCPNFIFFMDVLQNIKGISRAILCEGRWYRSTHSHIII